MKIKKEPPEIEIKSSASDSHSDWQHREELTLKCGGKTALSNDQTMDSKIEIKEELWWEGETTQVKHSPELTSEDPVSLVNKQEADLKINVISEDLPTSQSPWLFTEAVHQYDIFGKNVSKSICPLNGKPVSKYDHCSKNAELVEYQMNHDGKQLRRRKIYDKKHKCNSCEERFIRKSQLKHHVLCHSNPKPYKCDTCEKRFVTKSYLKHHVLCHSNTKPYKCNSCDKRFVRKSYLRHHVLCHSNKKPYKCDSCEKSFLKKSYLRHHVLCHSNTKPYKCDRCEKSFLQKTNLQKHTLCHLGTKPYKCNSCDKSFTQKSNLQKHILCHLGIKPHKCNSCEKSFTQKSHLQKHILCHSGTKLYNCDRSFTQKST